MIDLNAPAPLALDALVVNMAIGLVLSLVVAWYYEYYGQSLSNRTRFARLLPALTLITTLIISIVKSSLALSLGLVGSLSIIRFRTAIKEPEELVFVFIAIAIGMGVGADQRWVTVVGVLVVLGYMGVRIVFARKPPASNLYLNLLIEEGQEKSLFSRLNTCLLEHVPVADFRRLDSRDGAMQATYLIRCDDPQTLNDLIQDLKFNFPITEVSFIQQDQTLGG